jgi:hypothetical protein
MEAFETTNQTVNGPAPPSLHPQTWTTRATPKPSTTSISTHWRSHSVTQWMVETARCDYCSSNLSIFGRSDQKQTTKCRGIFTCLQQTAVSVRKEKEKTWISVLLDFLWTVSLACHPSLNILFLIGVSVQKGWYQSDYSHQKGEW